MNTKTMRVLATFVIALVSAGAGYFAHEEAGATPAISTQTVSAPPANSVRVIYSLTEKRTNEELIALIEEAGDHIYFAVYTFTLTDVADALIAAKKRGVEVRGIVDDEQARESFMRPVVEKLVAAGIPVQTDPSSSSGIMHIKALVTERAYAIGSYNWTKSATTQNDELLEIGTDPALVAIYKDILLKILEAYKGTNAAAQYATGSAGTIKYTEAPDHIGEEASVTGTLVEAYTSKTGTTFLNFCEDYKSCAFSAVIFASDAKKFDDLKAFEGKKITVTGTITEYQGQAEIKVSSPSQLESN